VALNLVEVARLYVRGWTAAHEARYAPAMQTSWAAFQLDPARFARAATDTAVHSTVHALVRLVECTCGGSRA
jgi:hypothetical protein